MVAPLPTGWPLQPTCSPSPHRLTARAWLFGLLAILSATPSWSQQETGPAEGGVPGGAARTTASGGAEATVPDDTAKPPPTFYLLDGSKIAGQPLLKELAVETAYGTLLVPVDHLVSIRMARRIPAQQREEILALIARLGHEDFDTRDSASAALEAMGAPALELLRKAMRSPDEETRSRAEVLVAAITKAGTPSNGSEPGETSEDSRIQLARGTDDEIVTMKMTLRGMIQQDSFRVQSRYGALRVAAADVAGIQFRSLGPSALKVTVASNQQPPGNWLDTKLDLEKGQTLRVKASGQISVRNYNVLAGPAGNTDWGGNTFGNFPMLSLVGKVGKKGQPFLVGEEHQGKPKGAGRLYLAIVPFSPYPGGASGSYQAQITAASEN